MSYQFDLAELYQKAFGITVPKYELDSKNTQDQLGSKYGSSLYRKADVTGRYYFMPVTLGGLELGYPIIRIQGRKNIVETQMTERKGSAIEIISQDNWKIYIRGFMFGHDRKFPEEQIYELKELYERNESLELRSVLTDLFLVEKDSVVIADINFPEVKGIEHVKPYEINLISDSIFELEIQ
jgi:hypothetical protein